MSTTVTYQVSVSGNDGYVSSSGSFYNSSTYMQVGNSSSTYGGFALFTSVLVPKDAVIESAKIQYYTATYRTETVCRTNLYFAAEDNPVAPTTSANYNGRTLTNAVAWEIPVMDSPQRWFDSPDISSIVQEIVSRSGWTSGNSMLLINKDNGSDASARRQIATWDYSGNVYGAKLIITYASDSTTIDRQVSSSGDDTHISGSSSFYTTDTYTRVGKNSSSSPYSCGHRFLNITIPQGAHIDNAYIQYVSAEADANPGCYSRIYANSVDDATSPTTRAEFDGKTTTSSYIDWELPAFVYEGVYDSPDISSVVQEIVDRPGWASGNAILVLHKDNGSSASGRRAFRSYDGGSTEGARLFITYRMLGTQVEVQAPVLSGSASFYDVTVSTVEHPSNTTLQKCLFWYTNPHIMDLPDLNDCADIFTQYDQIVFGDTQQFPEYYMHQDLVTLIGILKTQKPSIQLYGYVPAGKSVGADQLTFEELQTYIDGWYTTGATGVFLDEFGYDYGNDRDWQNAVVDYVHGKGMNAFVNAWDGNDVFSNENFHIVSVTNGLDFYANPDNESTHLNSNDWCLLESFAIDDESYIVRNGYALEYKKNENALTYVTYRRDYKVKICGLAKLNPAQQTESLQDKVQWVYDNCWFWSLDSVAIGDLHQNSGNHFPVEFVEPTSSVSSYFHQMAPSYVCTDNYKNNVRTYQNYILTLLDDTTTATYSFHIGDGSPSISTDIMVSTVDMYIPTVEAYRNVYTTAPPAAITASLYNAVVSTTRSVSISSSTLSASADIINSTVLAKRNTSVLHQIFQTNAELTNSTVQAKRSVNISLTSFSSTADLLSSQVYGERNVNIQAPVISLSASFYNSTVDAGVVGSVHITAPTLSISSGMNDTDIYTERSTSIQAQTLQSFVEVPTHYVSASYNGQGVYIFAQPLLATADIMLPSLKVDGPHRSYNAIYGMFKYGQLPYGMYDLSADEVSFGQDKVFRLTGLGNMGIPLGSRIINQHLLLEKEISYTRMTAKSIPVISQSIKIESAPLRIRIRSDKSSFVICDIGTLRSRN